MQQAQKKRTPLVGLTVKELTPERVEDYLKFFDTAFTDFPDWAGCYCGFYDTPGDDWDTSMTGAPKNRMERKERISAGKAHGLLAYHAGRVVGWCNAQSRSNYRNMRRFTVAVTDPTEPIGSIMCFLVLSSYRNRGISTMLLEYACETFKKEGLTIAEAYPTTVQINPAVGLPWDEAHYKGPLNMYLKEGFTVYKQLDRWAIVRKQL